MTSLAPSMARPPTGSFDESRRTAPHVTIRGLSKHYPDAVIYDRFDFDIPRGKLISVFGPNGCGKSTLINMIAGLVPADAGEVRWQGAPLPPAGRKERLFYLPEAISPYPDQTIAKILNFFRAVYRQSPSRLEHLVCALGLEPALAKPVGALSKGYRRRFLLALGLLAPRPMLLMDEPFDGFDLRQTREVMNLLRSEGVNGRTLVLSIHQLGDAQRVCDRLVLLSGGRVMGVGTLTELTASARLPIGTDLEEVFLALA